MYLKQLKLAGFKSFVDPVTIPLHSSLVAVVGPNGCGKSNIIDAVRWVMGESSAKNLRGETMSDVIFSGSSHRKPLGQASVELLFDNSSGSLAGQYGSYQEIAVKRLVTRDGESSYFLNGTRCRRRDITDIFLGTGVGVRGYSIIGQGTISRLIEARPDEMRAYLEEAAGTSKYKERRRETLQRIGTTRENLLRVSDIRDELGKQLQRLEQQAKTASRYKALCESERRLKAEICGLKWHDFDTQRNHLQDQIQQLNLSVASHQANATKAYQLQTQTRLQWGEENDLLQTLQTNFYQQTTEIARLEEHLAQQQRDKQRLLLEQEQLQGDCLQLGEQIKNDVESLQEHREERAYLQEQSVLCRAQLAEKQEQIQVLQGEEQAKLESLSQLQQSLNKTQSTIALAQTQATHNKQRCGEIKTRLQHSLSEQAVLQEMSCDFDLVAAQAKQGSLQNDVAEKEELLRQATALGQQLSGQQAVVDKALHQQKDAVYQLSTRIAALEAWVAAALGRSDASLSSLWPNWGAKTRLAEVIDVEQAWAPVCEMILGEILHGVVIDSLADCTEALHQQALEQGIFVTPQLTKSATSPFPRLADKIHGVCPHYVFDIEKIYSAQNFDEALVWLPLIGSDESIVTQDGHWLGQGWLRIFNLHVIQEASVLARQDERAQVQKDLIQAELLLNQYTLERAAIGEQIAQNNQEIPSLQQHLSTSREHLRQGHSELMSQQQRSEQVAIKTQHLADEQFTLTTQLEDLQMLLIENEQQAQQAQQHYETLKASLIVANEERAVFQENLKPQREGVEEARKTTHELALKMERAQLKVTQLQASILRDEGRHSTILARLSATCDRLEELAKPNDSSQEVLREKLVQHQESERYLSEKKHQISLLSRELEQHTQVNKEEEAKAHAVKEKIQQMQIEEQVLLTKANGVLEGLTQLACSLDDVMQSIPAEATLTTHEQELISLLEKIKRLGAINLAAIDEYEIESERKKYLDQQNQDLTDALELLEVAIAKIDQEMQQRFQTTFAEVNNRFQHLFPRLFGGGHAALELTCDNLLEAGVNVMAQPPGKRNSTIHLLSGGEKAMTAMALIFAIFQLNPSPFCMLDEVDAPLDDVNIGRFCALMKEMAGCVQFLFTTHSKVTLLLAEQLIGVTMREAGVSRIVAVDVEQALLMSETVT